MKFYWHRVFLICVASSVVKAIRVIRSAAVCVDSSRSCFNAPCCDESYSGTKTTTASGRTCQRWDSQSPHEHNYAPNPDSVCRVFEPADLGPWCYTTDSDQRWEYCFADCANLKSCVDSSADCYNEGSCDATYSGTKTTTISGTTCQRWDSQSPHTHDYTPHQDSFCRVFEASDISPWCYTTDPDVRWDYCFSACSGKSSGGLPAAVRDRLIAKHNEWRASVGVDPVTWDNNLETFAMYWNGVLGSRCGGLDHSSNQDRENINGWVGQYAGENLAWGGHGGTSVEDQVTFAEISVDMWGNEWTSYDYSSNTCSAVCGHYTQVVWRSSTKIGCGIGFCAGGGWYLGCNYMPGGNIQGQWPY